MNLNQLMHDLTTHATFIALLVLIATLVNWQPAILVVFAYCLIVPFAIMHMLVERSIRKRRNNSLRIVERQEAEW